ncbi:multicopper oxidase family protein [Dolichospermum circinale CS-534/05]|uniref:multicopper oxidase family protein n=1 Tax=Dolichospermum circinale TaxID=109265 RepID=UPI00232BC920|nr:multicopper oxidase family protein [Dolichospermum circinale]MDB9489435.1 multicopper oxidase family protein [Dolichospermum circinale CS-534/05]
MKRLLTILIILLLLAYPTNNADAATGTTDYKPGCEYAVPLDINQTDYVGHPFQNPESIKSEKDSKTLKTTLTVKYAENKIADCQVNLRSYNGKLVGPTLRAKPGDTLEITLVNDLPPNPTSSDHVSDHVTAKMSSEISSPDCSYELETTTNNINIPHNFNTTNFHTHGLHVDPGGCSDNVLRVMNPRKQDADPAPQYAIKVKIPEDHPSGTFWYHSHVHGSTALQVSSGMVGALIIEGGGLDKIPEIAKAKEQVFMFEEIAYDQNGVIENYDVFGPTKWQESGRFITINGQIMPKITMRPGEVQRWRFIHGGIRESINLELREQYTDQQIPLHEIAVDGIPLGKLDSWNNDPVELESGYRSDVLVQAKQLLPGQQSQEYVLIDKPTNANESLLAVPERKHILATVIVEGEPLNMSLPTKYRLAKAKKDDAPEDIRDDELRGDQHQVVSFNIDPLKKPTEYQVNGQPFDPKQVRYLQLNQVEEWKLESLRANHPFHIHVNPFQYDRIGPDGNQERIWRDTLLVTTKNPVRIRSRYTKFTGKFVLHCHILDHEDNGMMESVEILAPLKET